MDTAVLHLSTLSSIFLIVVAKVYSEMSSLIILLFWSWLPILSGSDVRLLSLRSRISSSFVRLPILSGSDGEFLVFGLQYGELLPKDELMEILKENGGSPDEQFQERYEDLGDNFRVERRRREDISGELKEISKDWRSLQ